MSNATIETYHSRSCERSRRSRSGKRQISKTHNKHTGETARWFGCSASLRGLSVAAWRSFAGTRLQSAVHGRGSIYGRSIVRATGLWQPRASLYPAKKSRGGTRFILSCDRKNVAE